MELEKLLDIIKADIGALKETYKELEEADRSEGEGNEDRIAALEERIDNYRETIQRNLKRVMERV